MIQVKVTKDFMRRVVAEQTGTLSNQSLDDGIGWVAQIEETATLNSDSFLIKQTQTYVKVKLPMWFLSKQSASIMGLVYCIIKTIQSEQSDEYKISE